MLGLVYGRTLAGGSTVLDGVKFSFWACRAAFGDSGLAAVKSFLFLGARDGETAIYCSQSQLRPGSIRNPFSGGPVLSFRRIATVLASPTVPCLIRGCAIGSSLLASRGFGGCLLCAAWVGSCAVVGGMIGDCSLRDPLVGCEI